jgi:hypothetical protein
MNKLTEQDIENLIYNIPDISEPGCIDKTFTQCEKCEVYLCYGKEKTCFKMFHTT